jgi:hypothetical protein
MPWPMRCLWAGVHNVGRGNVLGEVSPYVLGEVS